jgi:hypothetical protein
MNWSPGALTAMTGSKATWPGYSQDTKLEPPARPAELAAPITESMAAQAAAAPTSRQAAAFTIQKSFAGKTAALTTLARGGERRTWWISILSHSPESRRRSAGHCRSIRRIRSRTRSSVLITNVLPKSLRLGLLLPKTVILWTSEWVAGITYNYRAMFANRDRCSW